MDNKKQWNNFYISMSSSDIEKQIKKIEEFYNLVEENVTEAGYMSDENQNELLNEIWSSASCLTHLLKQNKNASQEQMKKMEELRNLGIDISMKYSVMVESLCIPFIQSLSQCDKNAQTIITKYKMVNYLVEQIMNCAPTPEVKEYIEETLFPDIEELMSLIKSYRINMLEVTNKFEHIGKFNTGSAGESYRLRLEEDCTKKYFELLELDKEIRGYYEDLDESKESLEEMLLEEDKQPDNVQAQFLDFLNKYVELMKTEIHVDTIIQDKAQFFRNTLQQLKEKIPAIENVKKEVTLYGKKIQKYRKYMQRKLAIYAKEHKGEILQKARNILKENNNDDDMKKLTAIITAVAIAGMVGSKVVSKKYSKEIEESGYEDTVNTDETCVNEITNNEKKLEPYIVNVSKLRLRSKPSTEDGTIIEEMQENQKVYIYKNEEILNPYDTHDWKMALYPTYDNNGEEKFIFGYVDANYLIPAQSEKIYITVPGDKDISSIETKDVKYVKVGLEHINEER